MTGSCERDADGSARPMAGSVRLFAERSPDKKESRPTRQGISSTDKDVTDRYLAVRMTGGFSSSAILAFVAVPDLAGPLVNDSRSMARANSLVDGRYAEGLDSDAVSVKLPVGKQDLCAAHRADLAYGSPEVFRSQWFAAPFGRCRDGDRAIAFRIKEVLPPARQQPAWTEGADPAAIRRTPTGNKAGTSCFMRTSGAISA